MNHLSAILSLRVRQVEGSIQQALLAVWKSQAFKKYFLVSTLNIQFDLSGSVCGLVRRPLVL